MVKTGLTLVIAACFVTNSAIALECIPSDPTSDFKYGVGSGETASILLGRLKKIENSTAVEGRDEFTARFTGKLLTQDGFAKRVRTDILVRLSCDLDWCPHFTIERGRYLLFVSEEDNGSVLEVGYCDRNNYHRPTRKAVQQIESCMKGGPCEPTFD